MLAEFGQGAQGPLWDADTPPMRCAHCSTTTAASWAAGRTPLTHGHVLCGACHARLPRVAALSWVRGTAPKAA